MSETKQPQISSTALLSADELLAIAKRHDIELCDACHLPRALHGGYSHKRAECLMDWTCMMLRLDGRRTKKQQDDLIQRLKEYFDAVSDEEDAAAMCGAGI